MSNDNPYEFKLLMKKCKPDAQLWTRGSEQSGAYDMSSYVDIVIPAGEQRLVDTEIAMCPPPGWVGVIWPRSGLAVKSQVDRKAGLIDPDYRDQVRALLRNESKVDFVIKKGDRIAQMIFLRFGVPQIEEVTELPASGRGLGGFGSTGV